MVGVSDILLNKERISQLFPAQSANIEGTFRGFFEQIVYDEFAGDHFKEGALGPSKIGHLSCQEFLFGVTEMTSSMPIHSVRCFYCNRSCNRFWGRHDQKV